MKRALLLITLFFLAVSSLLAATPEEIVKRVSANFAQIKDARLDITLNTGLKFIGCGGLLEQKGYLSFKSPDRIKIYLDGETYFIKGNTIRKIDEEGKRFYITLIHAPDFSVGFGPQLIAHNFNLKLIKEISTEAVIEGLPKPGVLKNIKRVTFHIDPVNDLLRSMDLVINQGLTGKISLEYELMNGLPVPVAMFGKSALEVNPSILVGLVFDLRGKNFTINSGLPDSLFDPGF